VRPTPTRHKEGFRGLSQTLFRHRLLAAFASLFLLLGLAPVLAAGSASAAQSDEMATTTTATADTTTCTQTLKRGTDFIEDRETGFAEVDGVWGHDASLRITLRRGVVIQPGCSFSFSLASYETEGATWPSSGNQTFIEHDVITLTQDHRRDTLSVKAPSCFGQVDLYHGALVYDGGEGEGHRPVPRYPDRQIEGLIAGFDGGYACATPSAEVVVNPCVDGNAGATVTLAVTEGYGSTAFTVWSKVGTGEFAQVGGTTTLPDGASRTATVTVPLVEDTPVTIEVRGNDGEVVAAYEPIVADCVQVPPSTPSADLEINPCVHKSATATVTLAVSEGTGSSAFTVWAKTGNGAFTQVGGTTTLPAGSSRTATVTVPLVEDTPVTIEVRVGDEVLETFEPVTANCKPDPVTPSADIEINPCKVEKHGKYPTSSATVTLSVSEGYGSSAFTVWAKVGNGSYNRVGGTTYLPAGNDRDARVTVPLVEDTPVTIQVRVGNAVVETFGPIVANCKDAKPAKPYVDLKVNPCVDKKATATVKLGVTEGAGSSAFTVWAKTANGSWAKVGGTTVLPAGNDRNATVTVPLVEDKPVTIQVRVGNDVLKTFDPITANCKGSSHTKPDPCKDAVKVVVVILSKLLCFFK
jgi:hypothetical protein